MYKIYWHSHRHYRHILLFLASIICAAICRKWLIAHEAMEYVHQCSHQIQQPRMLENLQKQFHRNSTGLSFLLDKSPILVMFTNQHALNMTINWLCNTANMKGVHSRLLLITLDPIANKELAQHWPNIHQIHLHIPCLHGPFNYGDGNYQLFFILRANIARELVEMGRQFWMIQQDTFWHANLLEIDLNIPSFIPDEFDILFDRADSNAQSRLIAGGHFFVRPNAASKAFFTKLANDLSRQYAPDNTWMSMMCDDSDTLSVKCGYIPFSIITNWQWLHSEDHDGRIPALIQFDGQTKLGGKLAGMRSLGFYFMSKDGRQCNQNSIKVANRMLQNMANSSKSFGQNSPILGRSFSQWQFTIYQSIIELFYKHAFTEWLLNHLIYPYAYYFMITI